MGMAVAKRELGRTGLQVTTLGYGAMELRGAPRARDITEAQAEKSRAKTAQGSRNGGTNGPDPDYSHSYPSLRGRVRLSSVGIWRRDRYRWYSADHTRHLFVARARGIVIFRNYVADTPDRVVSAEPGYSTISCSSGGPNQEKLGGKAMAIAAIRWALIPSR